MAMLLVPLPLLAGTLTSLLCRVPSGAGSTIAFRPPAVVFSIVWPTLFLLMGTAWYLSRADSIIVHVGNSLLLFSMMAWLVVYACRGKKTQALYVLLSSVLFAVGVLCLYPAPRNLLVVPLVVWLLFATLMNAMEVQHLSHGGKVAS